METTTPQPLVPAAEAIAALPLEPLGPPEGVTHRANHHHMWILDGRASILKTEA